MNRTVLGTAVAEVAGWCEAAGQQEPLTQRLKAVLQGYPLGAGLFNELLQNADDAGATEMHLLWDWRSAAPGEKLLSPEMKAKNEINKFLRGGAGTRVYMY